ncbi:hypothetical protein BH11MYX2_BH11MYX2_05880 [soil metagenome]
MSPAAKKKTKARKSTSAVKSKPVAKKAKKKAAPRPKTKPAMKTVLLAGGNPQVAKGDAAAVAEYISKLPGWKHGLVKRLDSLIADAVPGVRRAVKWNSPLYGAPSSDDFFLGLHAMTAYVKLAFFRGQQLDPIPPGESKGQDTRYLDIFETDDVDDKLLVAWVKQASRLTGWSPRG